MEMANIYQIHWARDNYQNLEEVLVEAANVKGHVRIVSVMWQPRRAAHEGFVESGYTIIAEVEN